jgi:hypothetical protein
MPEGRTVRWFDPSVPADDGDCVLVELSPTVYERFARRLAEARAAGDPRADVVTGAAPSLVTKILRHGMSGLMLVAAGRAVPIEENRILGVCTYVMIDGKPALGSGPDCDGWDTTPGVAVADVQTEWINPDAATENYSFDNFGSGPYTDETEDSVEITLDVTSFVYVQGRVNSHNGTDAVMFAFAGGETGQVVPTMEGGNPVNFPLAFGQFELAAGTHDAGLRYQATGGAARSDRHIEIVVVKR